MLIFTKEEAETITAALIKIINDIKAGTVDFRSYGVCGNLKWVTCRDSLPISKLLSLLMADAAEQMPWFSGNYHFPVPAPEGYIPESNVPMSREALAEHYFDSTTDLYECPEQRRMRIELCEAAIKILEDMHKQ